ncbi:MAG: PIN domain-containing protein [Gammaproteobacteria bacterium]|nr:PIN domain-containing protein [Gammaproteobacteria bacterium]
MTGFLLDTNVVSEVVRELPNPGVTRFLTDNGDLWISTIAIHELEFGLQLLAEGRRQSALREGISWFVDTYADRILPICRESAKWAAILRVQAKRSGRVLDLADALVAGVAIANNLTLATRNLRHFDNLAMSAISPWKNA